MKKPAWLDIASVFKLLSILSFTYRVNLIPLMSKYGRHYVLKASLACLLLKYC